MFYTVDVYIFFKYCSSKHAARTETMEKKVMDKEKQKQKDKKLINFYSFQMRETKMERKFGVIEVATLQVIFPNSFSS